MYIIPTTTDDVLQQQFNLYQMNLGLTLRYNHVLKGYQFDLYDVDRNQYIALNKGLSVNSPALIEFDLPFILMLKDKSGLGINAISKIDYDNRMQLLMMSKEEYHEAIW